MSRRRARIQPETAEQSAALAHAQDRARGIVAEPCHHGCRADGVHYPTCDEVSCRGCRPRPAEVGVLCQWCRNELERDLATIDERLPWLDALASTAQDASASAPDAIVSRTGDPAESTVLHAAALVADDARSVLAFYVRVVAQERGLGTAHVTGTLGAWLWPHLDWLSGQDFTHDVRSELARLAAAVRRFHGPEDVEPARPLDDPCPRCDQIALWLTPPRWDGQEVRVECTNQDCARIYSEAEWERLTGGLVAA